MKFPEILGIWFYVEFILQKILGLYIWLDINDNEDDEH